MNSWKHKALPSIALVFASAIFSMFAFVIAAVPLRVLRILSGRTTYWSLCLFAIVVFILVKAYIAALLLGIVVVLIGSFTEFEKSGDSLYRAGVCSILTTLICLAGTYFCFIAISGKESFMLIKNKLNESVELASQMYLQYNTGLEITGAEIKNILISYSPALLLMGLMASLFFAVVIESRVIRHIKSKLDHYNTYKLTDFKVPDLVVWIFILSLLGSFSKYDNQILQSISMNVFYVCVMLLFFQGLAVLAYFFRVANVSKLWQVLWYFILIVHLTLSISLIGLMDYWLNFRMRVSKRATQIRKNQQG